MSGLQILCPKSTKLGGELGWSKIMEIMELFSGGGSDSSGSDDFEGPRRYKPPALAPKQPDLPRVGISEQKSDDDDDDDDDDFEPPPSRRPLKKLAKKPAVPARITPKYLAQASSKLYTDDDDDIFKDPFEVNDGASEGSYSMVNPRPSYSMVYLKNSTSPCRTSALLRLVYLKNSTSPSTSPGLQLTRCRLNRRLSRCR